MIRIALVFVLSLVAALWARNASLFAAKPEDARVKIIAHRGVHHTYSREGLTNETCTAERIFEPEHDFFENTIPSMREAFRLGADIVEIDVHPTADGKWAVFHDWTIDCRTEGEGRTRDQTMAYLKTLDVGYGYTADGGKTFPLRGKGVGMTPTLTETLEAFPEGLFFVNTKTNSTEDGQKLVRFFNERPDLLPRVWGIYGGRHSIAEIEAAFPDMPAMPRKSAKDCGLGYLKWGWTGRAPETCRGRIVAAPINLAPLA